MAKKTATPSDSSYKYGHRPYEDDPVPTEEPKAADPETTRGGKLKQAWTDDATGKTYLPGETLEGDDVD